MATGNATALLVCDIDNTLTGSRSGLEDLRAWMDDNPDTMFAIATGRALPGTIEVIRAWDIPVPEILITAVGTEIYHCEGGDLTRLSPDEEWREQWARGWKPSRIMAVLAAFEALTPQPATEQRAGKLSYFLKDPGLVAEIRHTLEARGLKAEAVYSHGEFLDILPRNASKGHAVEYVAKKLGIAMEQVAAAGDSGNDAGMLQRAGTPIVVANHSNELDAARLPDDAYFADRPHAEGIVEGLEQAEDTPPKA